jgi:small-conductance mechanosensitive channel
MRRMKDLLSDLNGNYLGNKPVDWLIAAIVFVAIFLAVEFVRGLIRSRRQRLQHTGSATLQLLGRLAAATSRTVVVSVALFFAEKWLELPPKADRIFEAIIVAGIAVQLALWAAAALRFGLEHHYRGTGNEPGSSPAIGVLLFGGQLVIWAVFVLLALDNLGINITALVAGLGIGGIAIGLAAQGIFADLFAALSILFDKPFRQGEVITYDQTTARVVRIGLKSTRLRAVTGERKVISNANLLQKEITGQQRLESKRVKFALGIIYQTPVELVTRLPDILKEVVESQDQDFVHAGMVAFGASSLDFELEFDVPDPDDTDYFMSRHRVALAILQRFEAEGISFAYPTQTSFTAGPDGKMVMPYPETKAASTRPRKRSDQETSA